MIGARGFKHYDYLETAVLMQDADSAWEKLKELMARHRRSPP